MTPGAPLESPERPATGEGVHWALGRWRRAADEAEGRALVLAPTGKDAQLISAALRRAGIRAEQCADAAELADKAGAGAGAIVLAEEAIARPAARQALQRLIDGQPSWSDLPVLLLSKVGSKSPLTADAIGRLGNVTVLERPTQIATLVSAVATALRTRQRQYMMRTAEQRKDAFLATLAHELRNPLAPLNNALHMLRRNGLSSQRDRDWALGVMQRQSVQLTRLVDDLLDVARITQGKVSLQRQNVDVRDVIRNAAEISAPVIEAMEHTLALRLPQEPVVVHADAVRLAQCLSNLLNNAAKYTPRGGDIALTTEVGDEDITIQVRDTGVGIPADAMPRLFEIFSQVDRSRPNAQGGLGIGLSIVKTFVEMHGGTVTAESDGEGRGSTFTVRIPRTPVRSVSDEAGASGPMDAPSERSLRILVVDDNEDNADSLAELLATCGHEVRTAYTGRAALDLAVRFVPDAAILDIGLPDIDGIELGRQIHAQGATAGTMLIALSGWGQAVDRERSSKAGFSHHLIKPADPQRILEILCAADAARDEERQPLGAMGQ
jgi:signal transduction histidine kinase/ActR/RegA family two-component response regulator